MPPLHEISKHVVRDTHARRRMLDVVLSLLRTGRIIYAHTAQKHSPAAYTIFTFCRFSMCCGPVALIASMSTAYMAPFQQTPSPAPYHRQSKQCREMNILQCAVFETGNVMMSSFLRIGYPVRKTYRTQEQSSGLHMSITPCRFRGVML